MDHHMCSAIQQIVQSMINKHGLIQKTSKRSTPRAKAKMISHGHQKNRGAAAPHGLSGKHIKAAENLFPATLVSLRCCE